MRSWWTRRTHRSSKPGKRVRCPPAALPSLDVRGDAQVCSAALHAAPARFDTEVVHHARVAQGKRPPAKTRWVAGSSPAPGTRHTKRRARSSFGRAPAPQAGGGRFESGRVHGESRFMPCWSSRSGRRLVTAETTGSSPVRGAHGGFAVGKARGLLTRRGSHRRGFESLTLRRMSP